MAQDSWFKCYGVMTCCKACVNPILHHSLYWWCKSCDGHLHSCSHLQLFIQLTLQHPI